MPYQIQNVENGSYVVRDHNPASFPDGAQAAAFLKTLKDKGDKRQLKIIPINDPAADRIWQERERMRMADGSYVAPPFRSAGPLNGVWWNAALGQYTAYDLRSPDYRSLHPCIGRVKHHYAHVSMKDKTKLAYTPDSKHGHADRQLSINPGSYLKKYFSDILTHDQIADIVRDWQCRYDSAELKFARTAEEIVKVYQTGPRSCMSGTIAEYHSKRADKHPCEVYGMPHSDITMAYIASKNGISARVLVWEAKKKHSRIYGDSTLLSRELKALGYVASPMDGARIAKIKAGKSYVMPYIDDTSIVIDEGDHFKLWNNERPLPKGKARHDCRNTHGLSNSRNMIECSDCGDEAGEGDIFHVAGRSVCRGCIEDHYFSCDCTGDYCHDDTERNEVRVRPNNRIGDGWLTETWSERACERYGFYCEATGYWYDTNYMLTAEDGTTISTQAVAEGIYALRDGGYIHKDDIEDDSETIQAA